MEVRQAIGASAPTANEIGEPPVPENRWEQHLLINRIKIPTYRTKKIIS
jgi:hypothetical protein